MKIDEWESPIEIRLSHKAGPFYDLKWRYKCVAKIFGISIPGKWHYPLYYYPVIAAGDNPDGILRWFNISFDLKDGNDVQRYARIKYSIKTKADLWEEFDLEKSYDRYEKDLESYRKHLRMYNQNVKTIKDIDSNKN